jgi:hypothetical protein
MDCQVGEELLNPGGTEGGGMAEGVAEFAEADVLVDPAGVALLGARGEAFDAGELAELVTELHGGFFVRCESATTGCWPTGGGSTSWS